jgi:lysine 6-dehydrogenase
MDTSLQNKKRVTVLGAGLVGNAIAADLSHDFIVTSVDRDRAALEKLKNRYNVEILVADLSDSETLRRSVKGADIIVGALPGFMGYEMIRTLAPEKIDIVDISFFPEDPFTLDELAREHGITVITDCGVAPGMGNIVLGHYNSKMEVCNYECYVGGLPVERKWPWEYKAVFSPIDVIEEYTRPARYVENGHTIIREALSDPELLHFEGIGSLEAWNSDGLRTLIKTMKIPNMIEKTLRYPGCIEYLRVLREAGFFSYDEIDVNGTRVKPIDLTARLLFPQWELKPGEEDFTVMRIIVEGTGRNGQSGIGATRRIEGSAIVGDGKRGLWDMETIREEQMDRGLARENEDQGDRAPVSEDINQVLSSQSSKSVDTGRGIADIPTRFVWELFDRYDRESGTISMARTTGYTCTAAVHLVAGKQFDRKGICPPEFLGENEDNFRFILQHLQKRGVEYRLTTS